MSTKVKVWRRKQSALAAQGTSRADVTEGATLHPQGAECLYKGNGGLEDTAPTSLGHHLSQEPVPEATSGNKRRQTLLEDVGEESSGAQELLRGSRFQCELGPPTWATHLTTTHPPRGGKSPGSMFLEYVMLDTVASQYLNRGSI